MGFFSIPLHQSLIDKYHVELVRQAIIKYSRGKVLDVGCGDKPFYSDIQEKIEQYIGLEHKDSIHAKDKAEILGSADSIPLPDNHVDTVILTQVLEHIENPSAVLKEISRVMKLQGILIIAWPFLYPIHEEPRDFYRYTVFGLTHLAKEAGFEVLSFVPVSGFWITWFGFVSIYLRGKSLLLYIFFYPLLLILKIICVFIQVIDRNKNARIKWTWNYYAVLKKIHEKN
ncbi:MAG: class I SAM-dependent methyltransferase [Bacteroidales bacterium]|nr:class I SAM-dependent methyltransferase [Bacteroidales bacterium]